MAWIKTKTPELLTAEELRRRFSYDPETAAWTRTVAASSKFRTGSVTFGWREHGDRRRRVIDVCGQRHRVHRLAWLYMTGAWPNGPVDHINGDEGDNRWRNLRLATDAQNSQNCRVRRHSRTGLKGVVPYGNSGRYIVQLRVNGKQVRIGGLFDNPIMAAVWHHAFAQLAYGEYARAV